MFIALSSDIIRTLCTTGVNSDDAGAPTVAWVTSRVRSDGILLLERREFPHGQVVVGVGNLGRVELVVRVVGGDDQRRELSARASASGGTWGGFVAAIATSNARARVCQPHAVLVDKALPWIVRALWASLPVALGPTLATRLDPWEISTRTTASVLLWVGWAVVAVATCAALPACLAVTGLG